MSSPSPYELGVADAARAIRRKELSAVDLVEALLQRIDKVDTRVQAWALVDRDGARAAARAAADEAARGVLRGPLHGVPFGAKDIFYTAGLRTEGGSKVMAGFVPSYDATSVAPPATIQAIPARRVLPFPITWRRSRAAARRASGCCASSSSNAPPPRSPRSPLRRSSAWLVPARRWTRRSFPRASGRSTRRPTSSCAATRRASTPISSLRRPISTGPRSAA